MNLGIEDFKYSDLDEYGRLNDLAAAFDRFVGENDSQLFSRFESYRVAMQSAIAHGGLTEPQESELLVSVARHLGAFLAQLFRTDPTPIKSRTQRDAQVARFKKEFVSKRVAKLANAAEGGGAPLTPAAARYSSGWSHSVAKPVRTSTTSPARTSLPCAAAVAVRSSSVTA